MLLIAKSANDRILNVNRKIQEDFFYVKADSAIKKSVDKDLTINIFMEFHSQTVHSIEI